MDLVGFGLGAAVLVIIGLVVYVAKHPAQVAQANAKDLANTVAAAGSDAWEAVKRDLPAIISAENAQLKTDLANAKAYGAEMEAKLGAEVQASETRLAAVQAQVGQIIAGISSQPASTLVAPAVAAAQAEDVAAVKAATVALSPAS